MDNVKVQDGSRLAECCVALAPDQAKKFCSSGLDKEGVEQQAGPKGRIDEVNGLGWGGGMYRITE